MKNILLLNAGTRNKLVQYFKESLAGRAKVVATDSYYLAPAIYEADKHYVTRHWDETGYWDEIIQICKEEQIGLVLSLVDPELEILAKHKSELDRMGILVNSAKEETVHACFDKYEVLCFLKKNGYSWIKTYCDFFEVKKELEQGRLQFPLFVKPRYGSGSAGIEKVNNIEYLKGVCDREEPFIIQEFMDAQELGVDVYVDLVSGEVISIFAKKKLKMRAGETDKSVSYKNEKLFQLISNFAKEFGLRGVNDIDVFEKNGEFYISEVNPRFGGGYLHAYECGENFPAYLIQNMNGKKNEVSIGNYEEGIYMMKYFDIRMLKAGE